MTPQRFKHIIENPSEINSNDLDLLESLREKFPFYGAVTALIAKSISTNVTNSIDIHPIMNHQLAAAAMRLSNREWLYNLLTKKSSTPTAFPDFIFKESPAAFEPITADSIDLTSIEISTAAIPNDEVSDLTAPIFTPVAMGNEKEYSVAEAVGTKFTFIPVTFDDWNITPNNISKRSDNSEEIKIQSDESDENIADSQNSKNQIHQPTFKPYNIENYLDTGMIEAQVEVSKISDGGKNFFEWLSDDSISQSYPNVDKTSDVIDKFIKTQPSINRPKREFYTPEKAMKRSEQFSSDIATETLAKIFHQQGHYEKAILSYEKLQLKFPEKSGYFASVIETIKKEQNQ